jgi:hypothetical protein
MKNLWGKKTPRSFFRGIWYLEIEFQNQIGTVIIVMTMPVTTTLIPVRMPVPASTFIVAVGGIILPVVVAVGTTVAVTIVPTMCFHWCCCEESSTGNKK